MKHYFLFCNLLEEKILGLLVENNLLYTLVHAHTRRDVVTVYNNCRLRRLFSFCKRIEGEVEEKKW